MAIPNTTGQFRTDLDSMQIGDYIACKYTAPSGAVGYFSNLGNLLATAQANEIPITGTSTPSGYFYLLKSDKGMLIADRVIQTSISWDTLNTAKLIEGYQYPIGSDIVPLLTSNTSDSSITISASSILSASQDAYKVFDNNTATYWATNNTVTGWLKFTFITSKKIKAYKITHTSAYGYTLGAKAWTFEGSNDNTNWITLDTRTAEPNFNPLDVRIYTITNPNNYLYYRWNISASAGVSLVGTGEFELITDVGIFCSLSGGCAYADANGNSSTTDQSKGAFPTINEWDKYIVNSDLNGTITKGDDNIWHWSGAYSWVRETPILSINTNLTRMGRGLSSFLKLNYTGSSGVGVSYGFRPVLEYLETDAKATTLFY